MAMKKLYYTVYYERYDEGSLNGIRNIYVYYIEDNTPKLMAYLEAMSDDLGNHLSTNEEEIQMWLDENGYGDDEYEFEEL